MLQRRQITLGRASQHVGGDPLILVAQDLADIGDLSSWNFRMPRLRKRFPIKLHRTPPTPIKGEGLYQHSYLYSRPLDGGGSGWG